MYDTHKGSMHFKKKFFFLKKYHLVLKSSGFSGHDGSLENVLGLIPMDCEFFENARGLAKVSARNRLKLTLRTRMRLHNAT